MSVMPPAKIVHDPSAVALEYQSLASHPRRRFAWTPFAFCWVVALGPTAFYVFNQISTVATFYRDFGMRLNAGSQLFYDALYAGYRFRVILACLPIAIGFVVAALRPNAPPPNRYRTAMWFAIASLLAVLLFTILQYAMIYVPMWMLISGITASKP